MVTALAAGFLILAAGAFVLTVVPRSRRVEVGEWRDRLHALADDRRVAIDRYVTDGLKDASNLAHFPTTVFLSSHARGPTGRAPGVGDRRQLTDLLSATASIEEYRFAWVLANRGELVASNRGAPAPDSLLLGLATTVMAADSSIAAMQQTDGRLAIRFAVPVKDSGTVVGAVVLEAAPSDFVFPILRSLPLRTPSIEALLTRWSESGDRRDLIIGPVRMDSLPGMQRLAEGPVISASMAMTGQDTFLEFQDYRGVRVLASLHRLSTVPWGLVVKVDEGEALTLYRMHMFATVGVLATMLAGFLGIGYGLWHRERAGYESSIEQSRARASLVLEQANDAILFVGPDGRVREANRRAEQLCGYPRGGMRGEPAPAELLPDPAREPASAGPGAGADVGVVFEALLHPHDGPPIPVEVSSRGTRIDGEAMVVSVVRDVEDRKRAEARITSLNRVLQTLSEINQLIIRSEDRQEMLDGACRIAVESGGFRGAWIGLIEPGRWRRLRVAASHGQGAGYLRTLEDRDDALELERGPSASAARESRTVVLDDIATAPECAPWSEEMLGLGLRSSVAVPIRNRGAVIGCFSLYADRSAAFGSEVVGQVEALASNIGHAVGALEDRKAREQAEQFLSAIVRGSPVGIFRTDLAGKTTFVNQRLVEMRGRSAPAATRLGWIEGIHPEDVQRVSRAWERSVRGEEQFRHEFRLVRTDGSILWVMGHAEVERDSRGDATGYVGSITDITERRSAEAALREHEANLDALVENITGLIWSVDRDFRLLTCNAAWREEVRRTLGIEYRYGDDLIASLPEDIRTEWKGYYHRALGGESFLREQEQGTGDDRRTTEFRFHPIRAESGEVLGVTVLGQDITERRRHELILRESEARYRTLFDANPHPMYVIDLETHRFLAVNDAAVHHYGYSRAEMLRMTIHDIRPSDDIPETLERLEQMSPGYERSGLWRQRKKNGEIMLAEVSTHGIEVDGRRAIAVLAQDVTERQHDEMERARLSAAIVQAGEAVIITDRSGNIVYVNPAFEHLTGYGHEEVLGRNPRLLSSGHQPPSFYQGMWSRLGKGEIWRGRLRNRRKDGQLYLADVVISPVRDSAGRVQNYVGVQRDVTTEERLSDQLRQAQKMEAVGQLTGGIAHDFNNLLTVILGNTELVAADVADRSDLSEGMAEISQAARRGSEMIRKLLAFSRRERLLEERLDLGRVVADLITTLRRLLPETITIQTKIPPGLPPVLADRGAIEQMVVNLATNARDAMASGGTLTVALSPVKVREQASGQRGGDYVRISVSDTGIGMDSSTLDRIFEPFFTTKPAGQGSGLGMAMVYGLMKQHHGWVDVRSKPAQGTAVELDFPTVGEPASVADTEAARSDIPMGLGETILLVEDEEPLRRVATRALERLGYRVLAARDGLEALETYQAHREEIKLVLSDLVMPRMGGIELLERLRGMDCTARFLLASGYLGAAPQLGDGGPGDVRLLEKPWTIATLARRVRESLHGLPAS